MKYTHTHTHSPAGQEWNAPIERLQKLTNTNRFVSLLELGTLRLPSDYMTCSVTLITKIPILQLQGKQETSAHIKEK